MKVTGIVLLVVAIALLIFAAVSHLVLVEPDSNSSSPASHTGAQFSPTLALIVGGVSGLAGVAMLMFGGRGYSQKTVAPVRVQ